MLEIGTREFEGVVKVPLSSTYKAQPLLPPKLDARSAVLKYQLGSGDCL